MKTAMADAIPPSKHVKLKKKLRFGRDKQINGGLKLVWLKSRIVDGGMKRISNDTIIILLRESARFQYPRIRRSTGK